MTVSEDALISQYLSGDVAAFEALYERYAARLLGFLCSLGAPRERSEDVAQKTWLRVIEALGDYEPRGRFRPWLFTLAHRLWLDEVRSAWETRRVAADAESLDREAAMPETGFGQSPREAAERNEKRARVETALAELPDAMRRTVLLRIDGDLTHREIAEAMGCPLGTVLWRMREAQKRLAERLGEPEQHEKEKDRAKLDART